MKRKRKKTPFPAEWTERHERTQRMLAERLAYHQARIAEAERRERERETS